LNNRPAISEEDLNDHHLVLCPTLVSPIGKVRPPSLVDSGGTGIAFMNESYAHEHSFPVYPLSTPRTLTVVDGRPIAGGTLTHYTWTTMKIGDHIEQLPMLLTSLGHYPVILGVKWARLHGVKLDMHRNEVRFDSEYCLKNCLPNKVPVAVTGVSIDDSDADSGYGSGSEPPISSLTPADTPPALPAHRKHAVSFVTPTRRHLTGTPAASYARRVRETRLLTPAPTTQAFNVAMIGSAPFNRLSKDKDVQIFAISLRDIEKALETKVEVDPRTLVPEEFHSDFRFMRTFSKQDSDKLPPSRLYDHKIELEPGKRPGYGPLYGMSQNELLVLQKYLKENLSKGFIRVSSSEAASPVLFARKPGGGLRFCVDYRGLNAITRKNRYPIPLIEETLRQLGKAKWFSKFDVIAAFNKLRIAEGDEWKTAFRTRYGLFEYLVMPFGLSNAPSSFQAFINDVLRPYLDIFCTAYLDDVIVYSNSLAEHKKHVRAVVSALGDAGLQLDITKCEFFKTEVLFLGLLISVDGIRMDPKKIHAIVDWKTPSGLRDVQEFIGFANFYRRFIRDFSDICKPLNALSKKDVKFDWSDACEQAFQRLKKSFTTAPILAHFDPDKKIHVEVDSSDWVSGGIMSQVGDDGLLHPVAFFSKKHSSVECNYDIYDKELLAIIRALEEWRPECEGARFPISILTDHKNLEYFMTKRLLSRRQARWAEFLSRFSYEFKYRPGKLNGKADALTRRSQDVPTGDDPRVLQQERVLIDPKLINLSPVTVEGEPRNETETPTLEELFTQGYQSDKFLQQVLKLIKDGARYCKGISLSECSIDEDGQLRFRGLLYVPDHDMLRLRIMQLCHDSAITGHPGRAKTFALLRRNYYWPKDYSDVRKYVKFCQICRRAKGAKHAPYGTLKSLPVPNGRWKDISMDFIVGLPLSDGHDAILVVVDRLTKMKHLIPCHTTDDADKLAMLFITYVWKLHGLPESIVSDRGSLFTSEFWKRLCKRLRIDALLSTAFHPETDGQTEIANAALEAILRCYVNYHQDDWSEWLPLAEFALNNQESESTKMSPFFANSASHPRMGFEPLSKVPEPETPDETDADRLSQVMEEILELLRDETSFSQAVMTSQADRHRLPAPVFQPGDKVWLSARNLKTRRPSKKLDWKNIGPFEVIEPIGTRAYRLALPDTMKIHDVFHVWLLEPASTDPLPGQGIPNPPPVEIDGEEEWEVDAILSSRVKYKKIYYMIRWVGDWEDSEEPANNVQNAADRIAEYHAKYPDRPGPHNLEKLLKTKRP
jgi:hypothetical protein